LLEKNPFPDAPPKYVRALLYEYHFTSRSEREKSGDWWRRSLLHEYLAPVSLEEFRKAGISGF
ncbi:MAG TPA: lipase maturation factor family protein, partial [Verrucomicrobiae bacterium]|jgi:hypothetical protein|nr:lipase maturation factor family protein [Verrucomicrobiae bacterium]